MNAQPIEIVNGERLLLVNLNKSYDQSKAEGEYKRADLYEAARKYWYLSKKRADKADFVLGVYKGIVKIVIKPTSDWLPVDVSDGGTMFPKTRYEIEGEVVASSPYLAKSVAAYAFGRGGVVTYVPRDAKLW